MPYTFRNRKCLTTTSAEVEEMMRKWYAELLECYYHVVGDLRQQIFAHPHN